MSTVDGCSCKCAKEIKKVRLEQLVTFAKSDAGPFLHDKEKKLDLLIDSMKMEGICKETIDEVYKNKALIYKLLPNRTAALQLIDSTLDTLAKCFSEAAAGAVGGPMTQVVIGCVTRSNPKDNGGFLLAGSGKPSETRGAGESCG